MKQTLDKAGSNALHEVARDVLRLFVLARQAHWNVRGREFFELHKAFGTLYELCDASADQVAEALRTQQYFVDQVYPVEAMATFQGSDAMEIVKKVSGQIDVVVQTVLAAVVTVKSAPDVQNLLQDQLAQFNKQAWMFRAFQQ